MIHISRFTFVWPASWLVVCSTLVGFPNLPPIYRSAAVAGIVLYFGGVILCLLENGWVHILLIALRLTQIIVLFVGKKTYLSVCTNYSLRNRVAGLTRAGAAASCHANWILYRTVTFISLFAEILHLFWCFSKNSRFLNEILGRINRLRTTEYVESSSPPRTEPTAPSNFSRRAKRATLEQPSIELSPLSVPGSRPPPKLSSKKEQAGTSSSNKKSNPLSRSPIYNQIGDLASEGGGRYEFHRKDTGLSVISAPPPAYLAVDRQ